VWIAPVTAQVMMTFFCWAAMGRLLQSMLNRVQYRGNRGLLKPH
jgi:hypothetical protein